MSYQYQPEQCAPIDNNDDHFQETIQKDIDSMTGFFANFIGFANWLFLNILPFVLALAVVYWIAGKVTVGSVLIMGLLAIMFYIFINNMTGNNMAGALPRATYPLPSDVDGVSAENVSCINCL